MPLLTLWIEYEIKKISSSRYWIVCNIFLFGANYLIGCIPTTFYDENVCTLYFICFIFVPVYCFIMNVCQHFFFHAENVVVCENKLLYYPKQQILFFSCKPYNNVTAVCFMCVCIFVYGFVNYI